MHDSDKTVKRKGSIASRYEKSVESENRSRGRRWIVVVIVVLGGLILAILLGTVFKDYYEVGEYKAMLDSRRDYSAALRGKALRRIHDGNNMFRSSAFLAALEKGSSFEKHFALSSLIDMETPNLKELCEKVWLDKSGPVRLREMALGRFEQEATPEDFNLMFDAIRMRGAIVIASDFLIDKMEPGKVISHALEKAASKTPADRENAALAMHALKASPEMNQSSDVRAALLVLVEDKDPAVRRTGVLALAVIATLEDVDLFLKIIGTDTDFFAREYAAIALGRIRAPGSVPRLVEILRNNKDAAINAAEALLRIGTPDAVNRVLATARDADVQVESRIAAVMVLGTLRSNESLKALTELVAGDGDMKVRAEAARQLGLSRNTAAVPALIKAYRDSLKDIEYSNLRMRIVKAFMKIGDRRAVGVLKESIHHPAKLKLPPKEMLKIAETIDYLSSTYLQIGDQDDK